MPALLPMPETGTKIGRLTVLGRAPDGVTNRGWALKLFTCLCECGNTRVMPSDSIRSGRVVSCGCYLKERLVAVSRTHGMSKSPEYAVWNMMMQRCNLSTNIHYEHYGGRGIKVCDAWLKFENFYADMGPRPFTKATIDRVDNDGNYEPGNCKWATYSEQSKNKRNTVRHEYKGENLTLTELSEKYKINRATLNSRIYCYNWPIERAIEEPIVHRDVKGWNKKPEVQAQNDIFNESERKAA